MPPAGRKRPAAQEDTEPPAWAANLCEEIRSLSSVVSGLAPLKQEVAAIQGHMPELTALARGTSTELAEVRETVSLVSGQAQATAQELKDLQNALPALIASAINAAKPDQPNPPTPSTEVPPQAPATPASSAGGAWARGPPSWMPPPRPPGPSPRTPPRRQQRTERRSPGKSRGTESGLLVIGGWPENSVAQTVREDAGKILEALGYGAAEVFCTMKRTSFALARMGTSAACWDINRKLRETPVLREGKRIRGGPASPRRSGSARDGSATSPASSGTTSASRTAPRPWSPTTAPASSGTTEAVWPEWTRRH